MKLPIFKRSDKDVKIALDHTKSLVTSAIVDRFSLSMIVANAYLLGIKHAAISMENTK